MTVYIAGRQTGKTIYLIWMSAKTGAVIVAPTYQMVSYIDQMARKLGLKIPPPISVVEWAQMVARKQAHSEQRYLVDELQMVLSQMNVEAATLNEDYKEEVHMFGVKETCCTRCSHRDVCQYKEEYLAAQHAVDEVSVHSACGEPSGQHQDMVSTLDTKSASRHQQTWTSLWNVIT